MSRQRAGLWAASAASLLLCLGPVSDPDLPWHLSAGRFIAQNARLPTMDFLSWTKAGEPWVDFEWAAQVIFYALHYLGGMTALWVLKGAIFGLLILVLLRLTRLWKFPDGWSAAALAGASVGLIPALECRPEMFSFLFCGLQLLLLEALRLGTWKPRWIVLGAAHAALYTVWANLHAGFPVGLLLCGLYLAGEIAERRENLQAARPALAPWAVLLLAALLATVLTPYGPKVYAVLHHHWRHMGLWQRFIMEWSAPNFINAYQRPFWVLLCFSYGAFLAAMAHGFRPPWAHSLVLGGFGLFASSSFRTTSYFPLLVFPLALRAARETRWPQGLRLLGLALALLTGTVLAATAIRLMRREGLFLRVHDTRQFSPERLCRYLKREESILGGLRLYNPWHWGGYIGWTLGPERYKVFVDGRYIFAEALPELMEAEKSPEGWQALMGRRGVDLVVMENKRQYLLRRSDRIQPWRPYELLAMPQPVWALIYWDSQGLVFVRRSAVPLVWLASREYRLLFPNDLQYLSLAVITGRVPRRVVEAEAARYLRESEDPEERERLAAWLFSLRRELSGARARP